MRNQNLILIIMLSFFSIISLFSIIKTNNLIYHIPNIQLNKFMHNNKIDDLSYRVLENQDVIKHEFIHQINKDDFYGINTNLSYKLIIYRLSANAYEIYFNDIIIGSLGDYEHLRSNIWNAYSTYDIDKNLIKEKNELKIIIYSNYELGLSEFPIIITDRKSSLKLNDWFLRYLETITKVSVSLLIFAFAFLIFLYVSSEKNKVKIEILFFSLSALLVSINIIDYMNFSSLPFSYFIFKRLVVTCMYLSAYFMGLALYKNYKNKSFLILSQLVLLTIIIINIISNNVISFKNNYGIGNLIIMLNFCFWLFYSSKSFKNSFISKVILICTSFLFITSGYDALNIIRGRFTSVSFTLFGLTMYSLGLILIVLNEYFDLQKKVAYEEEKALFLYEKSIKDGMTDVFNHEYITSFMSNLQRNFCVMMLDIDDFKRINDDYGHQFGDDVIRFIAQSSKNKADDNIIIGRYGGDEFVYIAIGKTLKETTLFAELLKITIENKTLISKNEKINLTVSIGISCSNNSNWKKSLIEADKALYKAKAEGKSKIEIFKN